MINISFNKNLSLVEVSFNGQDFYDTLTYCKEENLSFNPETKL